MSSVPCLGLHSAGWATELATGSKINENVAKFPPLYTVLRSARGRKRNLAAGRKVTKHARVCYLSQLSAAF